MGSRGQEILVSVYYVAVFEKTSLQVITFNVVKRSISAAVDLCQEYSYTCTVTLQLLIGQQALFLPLIVEGSSSQRMGHGKLKWER